MEPSDQPPPVLGGRLMRPDSPGRWETVTECRTALVAPIAPGEILDATLKMHIPDVPPGEYILSVNMLKENRFWFEDKGSPAFKREMTVAKPASLGASPGNPNSPKADHKDRAIP